MLDVVERIEGKRERTSFEKAQIINTSGESIGVKIEITDEIRRGKERKYSIDLDHLERVSTTPGGYLPVIIDAFESYLVSPFVADKFANDGERDDWAKRVLLPEGKDVWEYFIKNRLSRNMLTSVATGLKIYARQNAHVNPESEAYAREMLKRIETPGDLLNLAEYNDTTPRERKSEVAAAYFQICKTFLGKLEGKLRQAA